MGRLHRTVLLAGSAITTLAAAYAGLDGVFPGGLDHPAIRYYAHPVTDSVAQLNLQIEQGKVRLEFQSPQGYLPSVLRALAIPVESQLVVFSKTSLMQGIINPGHPRSIFFNDSVAVGWVPGEPFVEVAAQDPRQGIIFYTLTQQPSESPRFLRQDDCLTCHESYVSLGVPGTIVRSVFPDSDGTPIRSRGDYTSDHRSPFEERWGGWYVTGSSLPAAHMGSAAESLHGRFQPDPYLSPYSDVVALTVFNHQMHMMNLLTRIGWEVRFASYEDRSQQRTAPTAPTRQLLAETAKELVDYLFFVDEAPINGRIQGSSGFAAAFEAQGPTDSHGRSLRQLDLRTRLMRYPCSYMIYTKAFDSLPSEALDAIYDRMWQVLSGQEKSTRYARLTLTDRRAIIEILRETKKGLPDYFL